jgi:hypothetical protein
MQTLCLNACFEANIASRSLSQTHLPSDDSFVKKVCVITSVTTDFASVVNKIKEGPKQRGSTRISYRLSDGSTRDVYPIILKALALDLSQLNQPYQQLNDRIKGVQWLARTKAGQSADQRKEGYIACRPAIRWHGPHTLSGQLYDSRSLRQPLRSALGAYQLPKLLFFGGT